IGAGHFMQRRGIACPPFREVHSPIMAAHRLFGLKAADLVLKADKPAAGRGVILEDDDELAQETLLAMTKGELFGDAGREVQISNRRHGPEISAYAISDGMNEYIVPFFAQDHKRLHDGDEGPNTGGMGAYADVP